MLKPCVVAVLRGSVWAALLLSWKTGCSLYMIVYVYMYYMLVRLSGCLNHIKGTIIIIIFRKTSLACSFMFFCSNKTHYHSCCVSCIFICAQLEKHFGNPRDIEFAVDKDDTIYLLQVSAREPRQSHK